jgi:hypothetical protein
LLAAVLAALAVVQIARAQEEAPPPVRVGVAPIVGPPARVSEELHLELAAILGRQPAVTVVWVKDRAIGFVLRPYILAQTGKDHAKVSYVIDVYTNTGRRVGRFAGDRIVEGSFHDPWTAVTPALRQNIAGQATAFLAGFLQGRASGGGAAPK